jgi:hypothetical protein
MLASFFELALSPLSLPSLMFHDKSHRSQDSIFKFSSVAQQIFNKTIFLQEFPSSPSKIPFPSPPTPETINHKKNKIILEASTITEL